jgi:hypothetical protein
MSPDAPSRSAAPIVLLAVAWLATIVACMSVAWETFPAEQYVPPVRGFLDAFGRAIEGLWPALFSGMASIAGMLLFPLTWVALAPAYRRTIPAAFLSCVASYAAAYFELIHFSTFTLAVMWGILALEGLRVTVTYLVHLLASRSTVGVADA